MTLEHPCSLQTQVLSFEPFLTDLSTALPEDSILSLPCPNYSSWTSCSSLSRVLTSMIVLDITFICVSFMVLLCPNVMIFNKPSLNPPLKLSITTQRKWKVVSVCMQSGDWVCKQCHRLLVTADRVVNIQHGGVDGVLHPAQQCILVKPQRWMGGSMTSASGGTGSSIVCPK